jgi:hypothetical protein
MERRGWAAVSRHDLYQASSRLNRTQGDSLPDCRLDPNQLRSRRGHRQRRNDNSYPSEYLLRPSPSLQLTRGIGRPEWKSVLRQDDDGVQQDGRRRHQGEDHDGSRMDQGECHPSPHYLLRRQLTRMCPGQSMAQGYHRKVLSRRPTTIVPRGTRSSRDLHLIPRLHPHPLYRLSLSKA